MSSRVFVSDEADIEVHSSGWVLLPSGVAITRMPLWDTRHGVFARIGQGPGALWLADQGLRHPTIAEWDELHELALHIEPFTLPTKQQLVNAGVDMTEEAIDAFRNRHMTTLAWCLLHDAEVFSRLFTAGWENDPVANAGKHWTDCGAIYGWWRAGRDKIQDAWYDHGKYHTGYGSTTHGVDPTGLSASESAPPGPTTERSPEVIVPPCSDAGAPPTPTQLGDAGAAVHAWQLLLLDWDPGCLPKYGADKDHGAETQAATESYFEDCGLARVAAKLVPGIDISSHQPPKSFDWHAMVKDHGFVIARACYGTKPDKSFVEHVNDARTVGLKVGGYIFFRQQQDPEKQLAVFEEQLGLAGISHADIVPAVDLEANTYDGSMDPRAHNTGGRLITEMLARRYGSALVYLSPGHFLELGKPSWVLEHRIWVAHWGGVEEPSWPWGDWDIWQVKATHTHRGFPGPLDFNLAQRLPLIPQ